MYKLLFFFKTSYAKFLLYAHTIRFLKFKQISWRVIRKIYKPRLKTYESCALNTPSRVPYFLPKNSAYLPEKCISFLNVSLPLSEVSWLEIPVSKLWSYNLHYFDYINEDGKSQFNLSKKLILSWIGCCTRPYSVGWQPYPVSLRIVNWVKWVMENDVKEDNAIFQSIAQQANWLSKNLEYHLLGNHLFANCKALIFAGLLLRCDDSKKFLSKGILILQKELDEQILEDGGHFELSPMYHSIILEDILDIISIMRSFDFEERDIIARLESKVQPMLEWLYFMTHPNGDISYFNDAAQGVAQNFDVLCSYSNRLGLEFVEPSLGGRHFENTGFYCFKSETLSVNVDIGDVGASYIPGHSHADTLSFEISVKGNRFLVNLGTSIYENCNRRHFERSTPAHSTACINDKNSSEVWSAFRVGNRAETKLQSLKQCKNRFKLVAQHDGYKSKPDFVSHQRELNLEENSLCVTDIIDRYSKFDIYFHFHPNCVLKQLSDFECDVILYDGQLVKIATDAPLILKKNLWAKEFGLLLDTTSILISSSDLQHKTKFYW